MNRTKGIFVTGTLTGLVIIMLLAALSLGNLGAGAENDTAVPPTIPQLQQPATTAVSNDEALQAWQQYSAELEQTIKTMQERETIYQTQMDQANQTILQLQNQLNATTSAANNSNNVYYEHEEHDDD